MRTELETSDQAGTRPLRRAKQRQELDRSGAKARANSTKGSQHAHQTEGYAGASQTRGETDGQSEAPEHVYRAL